MTAAMPVWTRIFLSGAWPLSPTIYESDKCQSVHGDSTSPSESSFGSLGSFDAQDYTDPASLDLSTRKLKHMRRRQRQRDAKKRGQEARPRSVEFQQRIDYEVKNTFVVVLDESEESSEYPRRRRASSCPPQKTQKDDIRNDIFGEIGFFRQRT
eukprot:TRINITY_DN19709_c0_g1_i1.p1 TRINITY_DN19709_c0_g1~~TRINITY_DN19709_c0_g1_i1.p1  ORF type:complete len:154 (-),score=34.32 TRINITY_DN19709_c0_g1_i1:533-994(-)